MKATEMEMTRQLLLLISCSPSSVHPKTVRTPEEAVSEAADRVSSKRMMDLGSPGPAESLPSSPWLHSKLKKKILKTIFNRQKKI
jgi:hypothetical protein